MKIFKLFTILCSLNLFLSCGVCLPKNLEFKNIQYFTPKSLENIDTNSEYICTSFYEADSNFKKLGESWDSSSKRSMKFNKNGFIEGVGMAINNKNEQAIIYTKNGKLLIDKIGATQDHCKFIDTYKVKIIGNKIYLLQFSGITNRKMCFEFQKNI